MRFVLYLAFSAAALGACTPEARVVDPPAGGGSQGMAGGAGGLTGDCAPPSSSRPGCEECITMVCGAEAEDCAETSCTCGDWHGSKGQISCLLACPTIDPQIDAVNRCAMDCGFRDLMGAHPTTRALFDCLVNPPMGPPNCPECFPQR